MLDNFNFKKTVEINEEILKILYPENILSLSISEIETSSFLDGDQDGVGLSYDIISVNKIGEIAYILGQSEVDITKLDLDKLLTSIFNYFLITSYLPPYPALRKLSNVYWSDQNQGYILSYNTSKPQYLIKPA